MKDLVASVGVVALLLLSANVGAAGSSSRRHNKNASDFLVTGLEKIEPAFGQFDGNMYAGLLPIDNYYEVDNDNSDDNESKQQRQGELMFWLFEPTQPAANDTLTIWFNGGPGCTSFQGGVLFECGPVVTPHYPAGYPDSKADEPLLANEWAWTRATHMLFVEQPTETGFSWGPLPQNEQELSIDFYNFLMHFYEAFPYMQAKSLYLFGESYAGMVRTYYVHLYMVSRGVGKCV